MLKMPGEGTSRTLINRILNSVPMLLCINLWLVNKGYESPQEESSVENLFQVKEWWPRQMSCFPGWSGKRWPDNKVNQSFLIWSHNIAGGEEAIVGRVVDEQKSIKKQTLFLKFVRVQPTTHLLSFFVLKKISMKEIGLLHLPCTSPYRVLSLLSKVKKERKREGEWDKVNE